MKHFIEFLQELEVEKLKLSERVGSPIITTAQRSDIKNRFMNAIMLDIEQAIGVATDEEVLNTDVIVGMTAEGLLVAVEHESLKRLENQEIPFKIEVKVGNLDFDSAFEIESYEQEKEVKRKEKEEKEKAKAEKIARDKEKRVATLKAKGYDK